MVPRGDKKAGRPCGEPPMALNWQLVVEFQTAPNVVEHVHRVGRTARAGREGRAVSLVSASSENEQALVREVERCRKGGWKYL